jgi:hypothetical protein
MKKTNNQQKAEGILQEAVRITSGARQRDYDHPKPNHQRIATLWNAYNSIKKVPGTIDSATDVAAKMILLKLVRNAHTPKRDNWTDIAGYARCGARIEGFEE